MVPMPPPLGSPPKQVRLPISANALLKCSLLSVLTPEAGVFRSFLTYVPLPVPVSFHTAGHGRAPRPREEVSALSTQQDQVGWVPTLPQTGNEEEAVWGSLGSLNPVTFLAIEQSRGRGFLVLI